MMIDFALEAERDQGLSPARGDLPGVPAPLPADHDDHAGGAPRRAAARARDRAPAPSCAARSASPSSAGSSSRSSSRSTRRRSSTSTWSGSARCSGGGKPRGAAASRAPPSRAVNISEPFIRRPVATSLLAAALLLAGRRRLHAAPGRAAAARRLPHHPASARRCPGASPETMASAVATPLERRFGRIAGLTEITSVELARPDAASRCSSTSTATSTPPRATCRPPSTPPAGDLPAEPADPAQLPEGEPGRRADPHPRRVTSETLPLSQVFDAANAILAQKISQVDGRRAGVRRRRAAAGGARAGRSGGASPAWGSRLEDVRAVLGAGDGRPAEGRA